MRPESSFSKLIMPLFLVFVVVNTMVLLLQPQLDNLHIDWMVVFVENCLLFALSILTLSMHVKALNKTNPNVFYRSVMASTMMKLFVLGTAAIVYLFLAGEKRSVFAVLGGLLLYVLYTTLEVRIALKMNQKK